MVKDSKVNKWDLRFLELCKFVSSWSKDPSTQTGAVIVRPDNTVVSVGYNGFPSKIKDTEERYNNRELKYKLVLHCEMNALLHTTEDIRGYTLYTWPYLPCTKCAIHFIEKKIKRSVGPICPSDKLERWGKDIEMGKGLFSEAGIEVTEVDFK